MVKIKYNHQIKKNDYIDFIFTNSLSIFTPTLLPPHNKLIEVYQGVEQGPEEDEEEGVFLKG